ncbi:hypothetical protein like AT5G46230 [Hibiscus trionum]|uniref:DUF538 family protein n=1 Tax=Hibiscus trionum TaxID=183268 RepID=A0A9W7HBS2_HIBTR|nr:hypothetical protein like AT5G46230 [Hibiscus trionum]
MASSVIESHKENGEVYYGEEVCKQKLLELLQEISFPKGILPVEIIELSWNPSTGFVWAKLKNKKQHKFKQINKLVWYDKEISLFVENGSRSIKKLTGVKGKELFIWVSVSTMSIEDPSSGNISFAFPGGFKVEFPISAFELEEDPKK